jgi:hypothetical protein
MKAELILDAEAVGRLNFQPRYCRAPQRCIASRRGDVLELVFALPSTRGEPIRGTRYHYHLESLTEKTVLATFIGESIA